MRTEADEGRTNGESAEVLPQDYRATMCSYMHDIADRFGEPGAITYFAGTPDGPVKVGWTGRITRRPAELRREHNVPDLQILATRDGGSLRERAYHFQFQEHSIGREWFVRCPEIEAEIARLNGGAA